MLGALFFIGQKFFFQRLVFRKNGKIFIRSGAGIVADSVPEREFQECINKAKAVVNAVEISSREIE